MGRSGIGEIPERNRGRLCYRLLRRSGRMATKNPSGVAQLAEQLTVNQWVVGSSPTPGATQHPHRVEAQASALLGFGTVSGDRACSSVGQSSGLIIRRSWVRAPAGPRIRLRRNRSVGAGAPNSPRELFECVGQVFLQLGSRSADSRSMSSLEFATSRRRGT